MKFQIYQSVGMEAGSAQSSASVGKGAPVVSSSAGGGSSFLKSD
jgi:hypothetical protein